MIQDIRPVFYDHIIPQIQDYVKQEKKRAGKICAKYSSRGIGGDHIGDSLSESLCGGLCFGKSIPA